MSELLKPPAVPAAILNFFASQPDFPAVAGDISEEFHQRAQKSGAKAAKRWYWREAFRNALALTRRELLQTPARTTLIAVSCFLAVNIVTDWFLMLGLVSGRSPWDVFATQLLFLLATGLTGGKLLPRREWALALTFTALSICIAGGLRWVFPVLRIHFSAAQLAAVVLGSGLRQGAFWLGCLWIRIHPRSFAVISIAPSTPRSSAPRNPPDPD
ncbi:MAG: hypothetical protein LAP61_22195 [Acidobacteriia bacterium]|nr:hypothetical protein [Terriglobia bacterium]